MGIWIELGVFLLVFVFAAWQFYDLRREKKRRLARQLAEAASNPTQTPPSSEPFHSTTASMAPTASPSPIASSTPSDKV